MAQPLRLIVFTLALGVLLAPMPAVAQTVRLTLKDGRATLVATQASAREILAEWARIGQVKVVNGDKLAGPPLTLEFTDVPERRALDTVLRAAAGYMAAPRSVPVAGASTFDRLIILPTSTTAGAPPPAMAGAQGRGAPLYPQPAMTQPMESPAEVMPEPFQDPNVNAGVMERPPETQFDYANPQLMQQQLQQMREAQSRGSAATGAAPSPAPSFFPSSFQPANETAPPVATQPTFTPSAGPTTGRPGEVIPVPQQQPQFRNPYGIPGDVAPGSVAPPADLEPDRSKYMNPYQPTPGAPPQGE